LFFEGAEKKLEILVKNKDLLRNLNGSSFWEELVNKCDAEILSKVSNDKLTAFLLSESSLFVWEDKILMLTCGQTKLINSAHFFINKIGVENIEGLFFQRKNEIRSHLQPTDFIKDAETLNDLITGEAIRLGKMHSHHTQIFYSTTPYATKEGDFTSELLMYDMDSEVIKFLTDENLKKEQIRKFFRINLLFKDYEIDDFVFNPYGYSLNGIKEDKYFTIHVTPQETSPYISFETNIKNIEGVLNQLTEICRPFSFDILTFSTEDAIKSEFNFGQNYMKAIHMKDRLNTGHNVQFFYYNRKMEVPEKAFRFQKFI